jgi:hypothetical protein
MRTDENNNPTAFTTDIAREAGLVLGVDYAQGQPFESGSHTYYTAKILPANPIPVTIRVIDAIGYKTKAGQERWTYICLPKWLWDSLTDDEQRDVIGYHYQWEGGTMMRHLFPNFGKP